MRLPLHAARPRAVLVLLGAALGSACGGGLSPLGKLENGGVGGTPACGDLLPLAFGRSTYGDSTGAPLRMVATCVPQAAHGCSYAFALDAPHRVQLSLMTDDFDGSLVLFGEQDDRSGELACVDNTPQGDTHHARISRVIGPGHYVALVTAPMTDEGHFELFAERERLPTPEVLCVAAPRLQSGDVVRGSTRGAVSRFVSACAGGAGPDAVLAFELHAQSRVRIRQQTEHDGILTLRDGCGADGRELVCNDDFLDGQHAEITRSLPAGTYFAVTDAYGAQSEGGSYALSFESRAAPAAISRGEACRQARALPLDGSPVEVDTFNEAGSFEGSCTRGEAPEALFSFSLPERSLVTITLDACEFNAAVYLLKHCENPASEQACALAPRVDRARDVDDDVASSHAVMVEDLPAGSYTLVVDGATTHDMGAVTLRASAVIGALPAL